jgi:hypothetical protein
MAGILGVSDDELCRDIDANTDRAFGGSWERRI